MLMSCSYTNGWKYKKPIGECFESEDIEDNFGFVYYIHFASDVI
jgi:hypothetical protein